MIRLSGDFEKDQTIKEEIANDLVYRGQADLVLNKEVLFNNFEKIKTFVQILSHDGKIRLIVDGNVNEADSNDKPYIYTQQETKQLVELNNFLAETKNVKMYFCDEIVDEYLSYNSEKSLLNLHQVIEANEKLNDVVEEIKRLELTPYETMLYIHEYVANIVGSGNGHLDRNTSATIMGAYTGEGLVCAGRSSLTKAIIDKLDMPGLSCEYVDCSIHTDPDPEQIKKFEEEIKEYPHFKSDLSIYKKYGDTEKHRLCLITLNDEKYKICGDYLNDATWDSKEHSFAMCCYPVKDVLNISGEHFVQTEHDIDRTKVYDDEEKEAAKLAKNLKNGKYVPDVVQKHGQISKPITRLTFESALKNLYLKMYEGNEDKAKAEVQEHLKNSINVAKQVFTENASNCFVGQNQHNISMD